MFGSTTTICPVRSSPMAVSWCVTCTRVSTSSIATTAHKRPLPFVGGTEGGGIRGYDSESGGAWACPRHAVVYYGPGSYADFTAAPAAGSFRCRTRFPWTLRRL